MFKIVSSIFSSPWKTAFRDRGTKKNSARKKGRKPRTVFKASLPFRELLCIHRPIGLGDVQNCFLYFFQPLETFDSDPWNKKKQRTEKGEKTARCLQGITAFQGVVVYP
jgi:hypothetical protein